MAYQRKESIDFQKLIQRSEEARVTLAEARIELRNKFDVIGRVKESLTSDPAKLVGGSLLGGFFLKKLIPRKKKTPTERNLRKTREISHLKTERGFLFGILALLAAFAKPLAKMYATKLVKDYLGNRLKGGSVGKTRKMGSAS